MSDRSFDEAYRRLQSILIDAEIEKVERHGEVDHYGLPTGNKVASVACYEPRLTNAVRTIGDWTFLVENRFITLAIQKIAMVWLQHKGGTLYGEPELMRAMRHCFKRFYAESLVGLARPPIGRALLLETIVFERQFMNGLLQQAYNEADPSEAAAFNKTSYEVARQGFLLCQRHEIGHVLLRQPGEDILLNTNKILDGRAVPLITGLLETGKGPLAEEIFCDLFALHSIIKTEDHYSDALPDDHRPAYGLLHLDDVRAAYFCYIVTMELSRVWFRALKDARAGWDAAEQGPSPNNHTLLPLEAQANERLWFVRTLIDLYIRARKGDIHERDRDFYFNPRGENLISRAAADLDRLSEDDALAAVGETEREIARYLSLATSFAPSTGLYLINVANAREWSGWGRLEEEADAVSPEPTDETAQTSAERRTAAIADDAFWKALNGVYAGYAKVFDAIVADLLYHTAPKTGTLERLEAFKDEALAQIESFGLDDPAFLLLTRDYVDAMRSKFRNKIWEAHLVLLTLMRRVYPSGADLAFEISIARRLSHLEGYAARNRGANVAAFAAILIPELETGRVAPTTML